MYDGTKSEEASVRDHKGLKFLWYIMDLNNVSFAKVCTK